MKITALESDSKEGFINDRYIWILLIISVSVRIYLSLFTYIIQNDSVAFVRNAQYFADGDFLSGLGHDYHPLYSFIMAVLYKVIPDMELAGTMISVSMGTLTVMVFYLIGKGVFGREISFVSAVILAFHPYAVRFSADIISESTYFFFFISALGSGFSAITGKKNILFALTGICAALAYLTRPEGIGIIFIVACWWFLKDLTDIRLVWRGKLVSILILIVSFSVLSMPYLVYIKKETGEWHLTKKKNLSQMVGVEGLLSVQNNNKSIAGSINEHGGPDVNSNKKQKTADRMGLKTYLKSVLYIMKKYLDTLHPILFIILIIGVVNWTRIKRERLFGLYIASIIAFYLFILYRLNITFLSGDDDASQYPSRRHLMPLVIPAVFSVGIGVYTAGKWMHGRFQNSNLINGFKGLRSAWLIQLVLLVVVVCVLLPKTLKPQRFDKLGIKKAGQWVREHSQRASPAVLSTSARSAYYAGGKHVQMEGISGALELARAKKADYILITQRDYDVIKTGLLRSIKDKKIALAYKYPEEDSLNRHIILLYKVLY